MMMHYLDSHVCYFKMGNNGPVDVSYINSNDTPTMLNKQSSEFWNHKIVLDYNVTVNELPEDFKNIAGFAIRLQRSRKYITYYYIPSGLLAIISCVSKFCAHVIRHFFYIIN